MIYFDFDKSNIRQEAALDLEKNRCFKSISKMKLDIRSQTLVQTNTMSPCQTEEHNLP
jgi:hypothetical protein